MLDQNVVTKTSEFFKLVKALRPQYKNRAEAEQAARRLRPDLGAVVPERDAGRKAITADDSAQARPWSEVIAKLNKTR